MKKENYLNVPYEIQSQLRQKAILRKTLKEGGKQETKQTIEAMVKTEEYTENVLSFLIEKMGFSNGKVIEETEERNLIE